MLPSRLCFSELGSSPTLRLTSGVMACGRGPGSAANALGESDRYQRGGRVIVAVRLCFYVFACAETLMDIAKSYNVSHMTISRL
jgi:hypothetical protein